MLVNITNKINQQSFVHGNNRRMYNLTNADLFDKFADTSNYYNYNPAFSNEEKSALAKEFLDKIVITPFIETLNFLIKKGADPHA